MDPTGAEAMVESAYIDVLNAQLNNAQQIQKINACLAGQMLYAVLAMRGYATAAPSLNVLAAQYMLGQANSTAQSESTNLRNYLLSSIGMSWTGTAWYDASPYLENPNQWAKRHGATAWPTPRLGPATSSARRGVAERPGRLRQWQLQRE